MTSSCYVEALRPVGVGGQGLPIKDLDAREKEEMRGKPVEDLVPISLYPEEPYKVTYVGASFTGDLKYEFVKFLRNNRDGFSWTAVDIPGIDPLFMTHTLNKNLERKLENKRR